MPYGLEEGAMNGTSTIVVMMLMRIVLPILALLALGTLIERRRTPGM